MREDISRKPKINILIALHETIAERLTAYPAHEAVLGSPGWRIGIFSVLINMLI